MNQEDVDLIYNYLHENYKYDDYGNLISIKNRPGVPKGKVLGCLASPKEGRDGRSQITCQLNIEGKKHYIKLSHLIYIFHYHKKPKYIKFIDGNITNTRIENIVECYKGEFRGILSLKKTQGFCVTPYEKDTFCTRIVYKKQILFCVNYNNSSVAKAAYDYANDLLYNQEIDPLIIKDMVLLKYPKPMKAKSGYTGVYKSSKNRFLAKISFKGINEIRLGYFDTAKEAHNAYLSAKKQYNLTKKLPDSIGKKYRKNENT